MKAILLYSLIVTAVYPLIGQHSFYELSAVDIDGNQTPMSEFRGMKILVVNVASECGFTPQYEDLQHLYEQYGGEKFIILGFPANNFSGQEPASNEEIKAFCKKNYGVTFKMMSKISVKGDDQHPIYRWLTQKDENGQQDVKMTWNFQKFLISENGEWLASFAPKTPPLSEEIVKWMK